LAARLHQDVEEWQPSEPQDVLVADRVLYWRVPNLLASPDLPFHSVFAEALDRAEGVVHGLWRAQPHPPHLLHGDVTPANAVVTRDGTVVPIDFQDLVVGFDVQDLAITLAALRRFPEGELLAEAFQVGYASVRPWPDLPPELLESLIAARALHQINLTLNIHGIDGRADNLESHANRLQGWLRSRRECQIGPGSSFADVPPTAL
jgi:Ser/Thr protein kinase RdoA (MazF antagonist)